MKNMIKKLFNFIKLIKYLLKQHYEERAKQYNNIRKLKEKAVNKTIFPEPFINEEVEKCSYLQQDLPIIPEEIKNELNKMNSEELKGAYKILNKIKEIKK